MGFSEVEPLSPVGRVWTVLLIVAGVGTIGYLVAGVFELLMEGSIYGFRRQKRMENHIAQLQGHTIICGYGRVGRQVVKDFLAAEKDIVVVDAVDPEGRLEAQGIPHVVGKAENESTLQAAGSSSWWAPSGWSRPTWRAASAWRTSPSDPTPSTSSTC